MSIWKIIGRVFGGLVMAAVGALIGGLILFLTVKSDAPLKHPVVIIGALIGFPIGVRYYARVIEAFLKGL